MPAGIAALPVMVLPCPPRLGPARHAGRDRLRAGARTGQLIEAPVVFTEGAHLPLAGLLLIPPAPAATGLTEAFVAT